MKGPPTPLRNFLFPTSYFLLLHSATPVIASVIAINLLIPS
jgi:hypothetical protein